MAEKSEEALTDGEAQKTVEWVLDFRICMKNSGTSMCVHPRMKVYNFFRCGNESCIPQI